MVVKFNKPIVIILFLIYLLSCGTDDKIKKNYTVCRKRIIEFALNLDPKAKSFPKKLKEKVLEICKIYGFENITDFISAKEKYQDLTDTSLQKNQLAEILNLLHYTSKSNSKSEPAHTGEKFKAVLNEKQKEDPPREEITDVRGRAVSLKQLIEQVKEYNVNNLPLDLSQFCGINKIYGYVTDEKNRDIIIFGKVDEELPSLYLEDFVIALRNAYLKYARLEENTYIYSNPGCTIDPNPKVLKELDKVWEKTKNAREKSKINKVLNEWKTVCTSPQKVGVFGVPFDSRFAWVMVKADYDMKTLVSETDSIEIPGFSSLTKLKLDRVEECLLKNESINFSLSGMNRFWFQPGDIKYLENEGILFIDECPVVLLTEEEHLTREGTVVGSGQVDPFAREFSEKFSEQYSFIAEQRPIYRELENLFRFVSIAKTLQIRESIEKLGLNIDYLLVKFPISSNKVARTLPGRSHVKCFEHSEDTYKGNNTIQFWMPSCGGVSIDINVEQNDFKDEPGLKELRTIVLKSRPSTNELKWDMNLPVSEMKIRRELIKEQDIQQMIKRNFDNANNSKTFIVDDFKSKYRLYHDSSEPIYKGDNSFELLNQALLQLKGEQVLCFDLRNFSEKRAKTFAETIKTQKYLNNIKSLIVTINKENTTKESMDLPFACETKRRLLSNTAPEMETSGKFKGKFRSVFKILVIKGKQLIKISMNVYFNTKDSIMKFSQKFLQKMEITDKNTSLMMDILSSIKDINKLKNEKIEINIVIKFLEQILGIEICSLKPLYYKKNTNIYKIS